MTMGNRSQRHDINRPRPGHEHKSSKYKFTQFDDAYTYEATPKQRLNSIHEKVKQH